MKYPILRNIQRAKEMLTQFGGYVNKDSASEGSFTFERNISTENYPLLSNRRQRGFIRNIENFQAIIDKDVLVWVDGDSLYIDNEEATLSEGVSISTDSEMCPKTIAKMGAYIIIFPDKIWYNTKDDTSGNIESSTEYTNTSITMH